MTRTVHGLVALAAAVSCASCDPLGAGLLVLGTAERQDGQDYDLMIVSPGPDAVVGDAPVLVEVLGNRDDIAPTELELFVDREGGIAFGHYPDDNPFSWTPEPGPARTIELQVGGGRDFRDDRVLSPVIRVQYRPD